MLPTLMLIVSPAHAANSLSLVPDPILTGLQMIPFFATMAMLHHVIFKPMIAYLEDRDAATAGARKAAQELSRSAEEKLHAYEQKLAAAREEVAANRAALRQAALADREEKLAEARKVAEARIADTVEVISGERELASQELERLSRGIAREISSKVLGREIAA